MHDTKKGGEQNTRTTILTFATTPAGSGGSCADAQGAILEIENFLDGGVTMVKHLKLNVLLVFFGACILRMNGAKFRNRRGPAFQE